MTDSQNDTGYHGLAAELYDLLFSEEASIDEAFYRSLIARKGGTALEVGCGTGRLLVPYILSGLEIQGLDNSEAMLDICRAKAQTAGITPILYRQNMQSMQLGRVFNTIYVPYSLLMYVTERHDALETLRRFYEHLTPGGQLLLSLFIPSHSQTSPAVWMLRHNVMRQSDGATILLHRAIQRDTVEQFQTNLFRYEVYLHGVLKESYLQSTHLRWYGKYELRLLLEKAGFRDIEICGDFTNCEFSMKHQTMTVCALK